GSGVSVAEERGAEGGFAAMSAENHETNGVEIGAKKGARLVTCGSAEQSEKGFLCQLFSVGRIGDATPKETVDALLVAREELRKRLRRALRKGQHEPFIADARGRRRG